MNRLAIVLGLVLAVRVIAQQPSVEVKELLQEETWNATDTHRGLVAGVEVESLSIAMIDRRTGRRRTGLALHVDAANVQGVTITITATALQGTTAAVTSTYTPLAQGGVLSIAPGAANLFSEIYRFPLIIPEGISDIKYLVNPTIDVSLRLAIVVTD